MSQDDVLSLSSETSDEQEWLADGDEDEDDGDEEGVTVISLLDDRVFSDPVAMLSYCKDKYGLDFLGIRDRLGLDFHGTVKLINFIRQRVHEGAPLPEEIVSSDFEDERYLKPVLDDDALVLCLDDLPGPPGEGAAASRAGDGAETEDLARRNAELQAELEALASQFNNYRLAVQQTLDRRWGESGEDGAGASADDAKAPAKGDPPKDDSAYYWESYAHNEIHETMLKDTVRTDAYRDFIYGNKELFAGKVVLDVGCGTGILSMFCAKAGAKQVIAVDKSDIIDKARENVFNNGLSDRVVCLRGAIEDLALPVEAVDVIVSEWMGYCLLYEAMLPSVLWARDRYLRPGGLLVPSHASLWLAPLVDPEYVDDTVTFWRDVYGFDMRAMQAGICADVRANHMPAASLAATPPHAFRLLDLHTVRTEDLVFDVPWQATLRPTAADTADGPTGLDGFLVWFDIFFARTPDDRSVLPSLSAADWAAADRDRVAFTTGPHGPETHWRQGVLLTEKRSEMARPADSADEQKEQQLSGSIAFSIPPDHARGLDVKVTWEVPGQAKQSQLWMVR